MHGIAPYGSTDVVETAVNAFISPSAVVQEGCPVDSDTFLWQSAINETLFQIKEQVCCTWFL